MADSSGVRQRSSDVIKEKIEKRKGNLYVMIYYRNH